MLDFLLPEEVNFVLTRLNERGYEAYVVGGCVRDHLMGRVPSDYDVTTNARPHEMQEVFSDCRVVETGLKHGTLTVVLHGMNIEVTTYRVDGAYDDGRHPNEVTFTASLTEDLCRRDFTVNAIAYSPRDGFVDPFGGREDILKKRITCVGDPVKRFSEDALRILRAIRFSSVLGFSIAEETAAAVREMHGTLAVISRERICQELTKLLLGGSARKIMEGFASVIAYALDPAGEQIMGAEIERTAERVEGVPAHGELRYAVLFGGGSVERARAVYASLKPSRKSMQEVLAYLTEREADTSDEYVLKKLMGRYGDAFPPGLIHFRKVMGAISEAQCLCELTAYERLRETDPCVTVSGLRVNGADAAALGLRGAEIGDALASLLDAVMRGQIENERDVLLGRLNK